MDDKPIISQDTMAALIGRPLSTLEKENYTFYLDIALLRLEDLLCIKFADLDNVPVDLQLLISRCFIAIQQEQTASMALGINKKQVEDFSISYESEVDAPMVAFVKQNASLLDKYSKCQAEMRSGRTCDAECFRCI